MKKTFFKFENYEDRWGILDDYVIGYANCYFYGADLNIYRIPANIAKKLWNNPVKDIPKSFKEDFDEVAEKLEEFGLDIEDLRYDDAVIWEYQISNEKDPAWYYFEKLPYAEYYETEEDFFKDSFEKECIVIDDDGNGYFSEPKQVSNMEQPQMDLEYIEDGDCIDYRYGMCLEWEEFWKDDEGNIYKMSVRNDNLQTSKNIYTILEVKEHKDND